MFHHFIGLFCWFCLCSLSNRSTLPLLAIQMVGSLRRIGWRSLEELKGMGRAKLALRVLSLGQRRPQPQHGPDQEDSKRSPRPNKSRVTMRVPWKLEKTKVTGVKEILAKFTKKQSQGDSSIDSWPAWRRAAKTIVASPVFEWFCVQALSCYVPSWSVWKLIGVFKTSEWLLLSPSAFWTQASTCCLPWSWSYGSW